MKKILFIALIVLFFTPFSEAKTLYVDAATGSDATTYAVNDSDHKWATLGRALWGNANRSTPNASEAATAGDTVLVTAGTYTAPDTGERFGVAFNPVNAGTSEIARIIIQAVGTVNLSSTGTSGGPIIGSNGKNYITWDGFTVDETTYAQLNSGEQGNCVVNGAHYVTIKNCILIGTTSTQTDQNHHAIYYSGSNYGYIYNNTIYNVRGVDINVEGILTYSSNNLLIEHNNIYNSSSGIFLKGGTSDSITVRYNKMYDLTYWGIRFGATAGAQTNHLIYQNVIYNALIGIFSYYSVGAGCKVVNNTVYNATRGIQIHNESNEILYYNNIIHTATTSSVYSESYSVPNPNYHDFQHNVYYGAAHQWSLDGGGFQEWAYWTGTWVQDTVSPAGISGTDPLFANIGSTDFRLCTGAGVPDASCSGASPAIALGVDILDLDYDGNTTENIPAGAYITGSETIGIESGGDTTVPIMTSATIAATGNSVTLAYSENVTQGVGYNDSDLDIDCSGGANIAMTYSSGNGTNTHIYTLARTVLSSETGCNLDFNGDANSLIDGASNDLAAIVSGAVTNSSTQAYPTVSSASIDATGRILTITHSENVRIGSGGTGGTTLTSCSGGAVTMAYTSNNGAAVVYGEPSRTIQSGETGCVLGYTQPGNGIESATSPNYLDVQTYVDQAVTNNSTAGASSGTGTTLGGGLSISGGGSIN